MKKMQRLLHLFYERFKFYKLSQKFNFLLRKSQIKSYDFSLMKSNLRTLITAKKEAILEGTARGKLNILDSFWRRLWFYLKNVISLGAFSFRTRQIIIYTLISSTWELNNPLDKRIFKTFLPRKVNLVRNIATKFPDLQKELNFHIDLYERNSWMQQRIIKEAHKILRKQKESEIVENVKKALQGGIHPILVTSGISGTYWMRDSAGEAVGIFKPFDEEVFAPNNPLGVHFQGALGLRRMRRGLRVGQSMYREVAAYSIDQYFGFGLVPKTYYACFEHPIFYHAQEEKEKLHRSKKKKIGSFQECIEGFIPLSKLGREMWVIKEEDFQLLVLLDVIIGNLDRNLGNILIKEKEIAAIDHGLCFSDFPEDLSVWYWSKFSWGKKVIHPVFGKLLEDFPFDDLSCLLKRRCFFEEPVLRRMRERVVLFRAGVRQHLSINNLQKLLIEENLYDLKDYKETLEERAKDIVNQFIASMPSSSS